MKRIAFDTETFLINQAGKASLDSVPRLVCMSVGDGRLFSRKEAVGVFLEWIDDPETVLVGLNVVFDLAVMERAVAEETGRDILPNLFQMLEASRISDVGIRARLNDIGKGGMFIRGAYDLASLERRYLNVDRREQKKGDVWRLRYNELDGVPIRDYPKAAAEYAIADAVYTQQLDDTIEPHASEPFQCMADWALHLMSAWGLMLDEEWAEKLDGFYAKEEERYRTMLQKEGIIRAEGTMDTKAKRAIYEEAFRSLGEFPMMTKSGKHVATDKKATRYLEDAGIEDGRFAMLTGYNRARKYRSTYLEPILDAQEGPLCPRFNVIVDTGRTSSSGPNVQNLPSRSNDEEKKRAELLNLDGDEEDELRIALGAVKGADIRGCFVPREGHVFVGADYSALEMATLAQVLCTLTGELTPLGVAINEGKDLHSMVAATMLGISYEEVVAKVAMGDTAVIEARQVCKIANFGFAGGASADTFRSFARQFGTTLSLHEAEKIKRVWLSTWTEMPFYFSYITSLQRGKYYHIQQHGPRRIQRGWRLRKADKYTKAANSLFQGLAADGAKFACWNVTKACFDPESPLYGCRLVLFIHDELIVEVPKGQEEEAGAELARIMIDSMKTFCPDIVIAAEPEVMEERWRK